MIAHGDPKDLLKNCEDPRVHTFLTRGGEEADKSAREHG